MLCTINNQTTHSIVVGLLAEWLQRKLLQDLLSGTSSTQH